MLDKTFLPRAIEAKFYAAWEKCGSFRSYQKPDAEPYVIMMPPPNVTGSLHMGHALTYTLQDILVRYHRMRGRDVLWQPGMDHAGIATQLVVERQMAEEGLKRQDLGREKFIERVWKWKAESGGAILSQQRQLGLSPDWERQRFTLDEGLNKAVRHVFVELYKAGLIYRSKRLVNWNPKLLTAVSDLEVKSIETKGKLYFIRYQIEHASDFITVATTRPETLFGDTAIAVHPEDKRYEHLVGKRAIVPLQGRIIPIITDTHCDPEKGTGAVKITPAHDFNDFEVGQRHGLDMISIFDEKAHLNENVVESFRGLERFTARKKVVESLEVLGFLEKMEDILHMVPHGERLDAILEPCLTDQWFVDAKTLAEPALEAVQTGKTQIIPQQWTSTYYHWLNNIQPWCISRQLWWGHRIPAWYGPDQKIFVAETEEEAFAQARDYYGQEVSLTQEEDVLDTWFSAALWPFSTLGWPEKTPELMRYYPTSLLVTGLDILFFWVARMMMMGLYFMKEVPFKKVYLHTLVRDEQGQKMSKTKGNVINPLELMEMYGADALRFSMAALAAPARDVKFSPSIVEGYRNFATKLWNATRFCLQNECFYRQKFNPQSCTLSINRWMAGEIVRLGRTLDLELADYHFNAAASALYQTVWRQFCDWYLEFIKPVLLGNDEDMKKETRDCAGWCVGMLSHLLHPFMPFITEEIWQHIAPEQSSLLITSLWPFQDETLDALVTDPAQKDITWIINLITALRGLRSDLNLTPSLNLTVGLFEGSDEARQRLLQYQPLLEKLGRIERIEENSKIPEGAAQLVLEDATFYVPVGDVIDVVQEQKRLQKSLLEIGKEIQQLQMKLENKEFIAKAPSEIIEKNQDRLREIKEIHARYEQALKSFV
ncbi:valine--tRNA ligase [Caedimonas varicaedens]|uniref:Valine--tRNA ligase n=1 Tax=Caedimonas varicaedens TaxID=1629334 RepID=A0A0K8MCA3_9PROT|nr:valine--tRNA ligase [Caedimonas varicaedens]